MKRLTDVIISVAGLVLLAPVLIFLATLIKINLGSPVFFKQVRAGKGAKPFMIFKFRTMLNTTESNGHLLPDQERITPFGSFLRRSSLDEFPELWNVLKGDMSLIGPRPDYFVHALEYLKNVEGYSDRHTIRPGITGLSQIRLGYVENLETVSKKVSIDNYYIQNVGYIIELKIIFSTILVILRGIGK